MLSLEHCKKILSEGGNKYTDKQAQELRDLLYQLARIECKQFQIKENEKRNNLHTCINR